MPGGDPRRVEALVFDFDGVIVETEAAEYLAWHEIWAEHGHDLRLDEWAGGLRGPGAFHPFHELSLRTGLDLDEGTLGARKTKLARRRLASAELREGVSEWAERAQELGIGVAIASSSPRDWIDSFLVELGVQTRWPVIVCFDDCGVRKPDPAAYRLACERLSVDPGRAIAVEDSRTGLLAAKAAGLFCVAVPTEMTQHLDFGEADLVIRSMLEVGLDDLIAQIRGVR